MSELLDKLASCELVTEWVGPYDERLIFATGETPPNSGALVRDPWDERQRNWPQLATEVKRLIVPQLLAAKVIANVAHEEGAPDWNWVALNTSNIEDWPTCFPVNEQTRIFERAWAAVGLCSNILGLAVFARQQENNGVEARVQLVPDRVFEKIVRLG